VVVAYDNDNNNDNDDARQMDTLQGMARMHRDSTLRASPFCHESADRRREMRGWVLDTPGDAVASALPVPYNLFHGVSIAMCETTEAEVLALMQAPADTRRRLGAAIDALMARALSLTEESAAAAHATTANNNNNSKPTRTAARKAAASTANAVPAACLLTPPIIAVAVVAPPPPPPPAAAANAAAICDRRATWARCRPALDGVPMSLHGAVGGL
jgi:hypothetical protein